VSTEGLKLLSVAEIGATKAYSIGRRGTYKDYVDLYFIIKDGAASLQSLVAMAETKFRNEFNARLFLEQLLFMEDIEDYKIDFLGKRVPPEEILEFFRGEIRMFSLYPDDGF
jgi:hypothetical protein